MKRIIPFLVFILLLILFFRYGYAQEQPTPLFGNSKSTADAPWYIVLLIVALPGIMAQVANITLMRYVQGIYMSDNAGKKMKMGTTLKLTILYGAGIGLVSQIALQKLVQTLTGIPIIWELLLLSLFTGIVSMLLYELILIGCVGRYNKTKKSEYLAFYEWLSNKKTHRRMKKINDAADGEDVTVNGYTKFIDNDK